MKLSDVLDEALWKGYAPDSFIYFNLPIKSFASRRGYGSISFRMHTRLPEGVSFTFSVYNSPTVSKEKTFHSLSKLVKKIHPGKIISSELILEYDERIMAVEYQEGFMIHYGRRRAEIEFTNPELKFINSIYGLKLSNIFSSNNELENVTTHRRVAKYDETHSFYRRGKPPKVKRIAKLITEFPKITKRYTFTLKTKEIVFVLQPSRYQTNFIMHVEADEDARKRYLNTAWETASEITNYDLSQAARAIPGALREMKRMSKKIGKGRPGPTLVK